MCFTGDGGGHGDAAWHRGKSSRNSKGDRENSINCWEFSPLPGFTLQWPTDSSQSHQNTAFLQSLFFFPLSLHVLRLMDFAQPKAFFPGGSQPCQWLGSSPSHKPLTALVGERNNHLSQKTKQTPTNKQTNIKKTPNNQESPQMNSSFFA